MPLAHLLPGSRRERGQLARRGRTHPFRTRLPRLPTLRMLRQQPQTRTWALLGHCPTIPRPILSWMSHLRRWGCQLQPAPRWQVAGRLAGHYPVSRPC